MRVDTNDYSVDPHLIGRPVDVHADLDILRERAEGRVVASHRRVWARHMTVTDPAHLEAAAGLRRRFQYRPVRRDSDNGLIRDLADYDRAYGVAGEAR